VRTIWDEHIRNDLRLKGYVYGQQKSIALFNCTGDWAFYLEGDEVVHENDLSKIQEAMRRYLADDEVEALIFDYIHFYGNANTYAWSPRWYRRAPRIIRNTIPAWAPKGLFFIVMKDHKTGRYPKAAHTGATVYHYGWVRSEEQMNLKGKSVGKYWQDESKSVDYSQIDPRVLRPFTGTHPKVMRDWLSKAEGLFQADPNHRLTRREWKNRLMLKLERSLGLELSKCHYRLIR
jgi:glycosyltransferase involved in cell wall biosynthesis